MTTTDDTIAGLTVGDITDYLRRRMHRSYPLTARDAAKFLRGYHNAARDSTVAPIPKCEAAYGDDLISALEDFIDHYGEGVL